MPGIAGIFTEQNNPNAEQLLDRMLQSMMHEQFYTASAHVDHKRGWLTGSVAIRNTTADCKPIFNETRSVALVLAGECFSDVGTRNNLRCHYHDFAPDDASYIVHLYEEEGLDFVKRLNGLFSGVLLDGNTGRAILFNDRYGLQKIYYHEGTSDFYFASEAKALLAALPSLRTMASKSLAEYLCFDCVLDERSYFPGISLLPGGTLLVYENGHVERSSYYDPVKFENEPALDIQSFLNRLSSTFEKALLRQVNTVGEKSIALTGGLDTRLMLACLPRECRNVTTLTFGGMYRDSMDLRLARDLSKACHLTHHTIRLDKEFLSDYGKHAARAVYLTDGLADATNVDNVYLNNRARSLAPIKLTGAFGSQVLGRVKRALRYRPPTSELLSGDFKPFVAVASESLTSWEGERNLSFCLKREVPWYWSRFIVAEMSQLTLRLPFLDNELVDLLYLAPREGFDGSKFEISAIAEKRPELLNIRTNKGIGGTAPGAVSSVIQLLIKARALTEKSFNWDVLPHSLQHVAARIDTMVLSPLHLNRLVNGWEYFRHYNVWFRSELAPYLKEVLLDEQTLRRPYWNPKYLETMVNDHVCGRRNNLSDIRKVLTVELISRELLAEHSELKPTRMVAKLSAKNMAANA